MSTWLIYTLSNYQITDCRLVFGASVDELGIYIRNNLDEFHFYIEYIITRFFQKRDVVSEAIYQFIIGDDNDSVYDMKTIVRKIGKEMINEMSDKKFIKVCLKNIGRLARTPEDLDIIYEKYGTRNLYKCIQEVLTYYSNEDIVKKMNCFEYESEYSQCGIVEIDNNAIFDTIGTGIKNITTDAWIAYSGEKSSFGTCKVIIADSADNAGEFIRNNLAQFTFIFNHYSLCRQGGEIYMMLYADHDYKYLELDDEVSKKDINLLKRLLNRFTDEELVLESWGVSHDSELDYVRMSKISSDKMIIF